MIFINSETLEYPRFIGDIKILHPQWEDFDNPPTPFEKVEGEVPLDIPSGYRVDEIIPRKINNIWIRFFTSPRPMTIDEVNEYTNNIKNKLLNSGMPEKYLEDVNINV